MEHIYDNSKPIRYFIITVVGLIIKKVDLKKKTTLFSNLKALSFLIILIMNEK